MSFQGRSLDEREAASIVAGLHSNATNSVGVASAASAGTKRSRARADTFTDENPKKKAPPAARGSKTAAMKEPPMDATGLVFAQPELKPAPYFYYTDHSLEQDDDPLTPITAAGSVPTFPAKMHAILTNPALADVVGWAPHGRSWRILKPRDFEIRVLPKYFEHSKFSSFVRQANGWGFRRMSGGYDKNAYYHEYFLRSMPWLCKKMRRPKVAEKKAVGPGMEPDFDAISLQLPVPDRPPTREVLVLQKTIELGPKARMPVVWDTGTPPAAPSSPVRGAVAPADIPAEVQNLPTLNHSASYGDLKPAALPVNPPAPAPVAPLAVPQEAAPVIAANTMATMGNNNIVQNNVQQFSENNNMPHPAPMQPSNQNNFNSSLNFAAAASASAQPPAYPPSNTNQVSVPPPNNFASDSNFAAGFMAATAYHSNQIRTMLSQAFAAGMPIPDHGNMMPAAAAAPPASNFLQMAGMTGNNFNNNFQAQQPLPQANPSFAAAAPAAPVGRAGGDSQPNSLADQAMRRLQQFQAEASMGDASPSPFPPRNP